MNANYTLQFADGTGSTTTALALINAGLPNLRSINPLNYDQRHRIVFNVDYRYGSGDDYNGPMLGKSKQVHLRQHRLEFDCNLGSGTPYTASVIPTPITGEISPSTEGSLNGSRLPWQFTLNTNIDKSFELTFGEGEDQKKAFLNVYFWITNLLNTQNITGCTAHGHPGRRWLPRGCAVPTAHQLTKRPGRVPQLLQHVRGQPLQPGCSPHHPFGREA